jgi:hypothetical protein
MSKRARITNTLPKHWPPWRYVISLCIGLFATTALAQSRGAVSQKSADVFGELNDRFTLRFFDAVKGDPISQASVDCFGSSSQTDGEGAASFPFPADLGPDEIRQCTFQKRGYVTSKIPVHFMVGTLFQNRYSISPSLEAEQLRVVLDWGKQPADLDAHLVKTGVYHLSYRQMRRYEDSAWLDRDDQSGFGPETVTIQRLDPDANYRFYVHDYTHRSAGSSKDLSTSRARVMVFSGQGLLHSFPVPANERGNHWAVFEIKGGQVQPIQQLSAKP